MGQTVSLPLLGGEVKPYNNKHGGAMIVFKILYQQFPKKCVAVIINFVHWSIVL
jgi:hypothetical protein